MSATVAIARCRGYERSAVTDAVGAVLRDLGGADQFISAGQSVFIKPNLLSDKEPERAVTTHPEIVRGLIRAVREQGGIPSVGDSPANVTKIERVWERTGMRAICDEEDVPLVNLEQAGSVPVDVDGISVGIARPVLDADVVINVPKVKTHLLTVFTGAVKNIYGTIPGFQKTRLHKFRPMPDDFGRLVAGLHHHVRPVVSVADAVVAMSGEGPSGGKPEALGFLAASSDAAALDATLCRILGIDVRAVKYLAHMHREGLGETASENITTVGVPPAEVTPAAFRSPSTLIGRSVPGWLIRWLKAYLWIRPAFGDPCVSCGRCVKACPADALTLPTGERPQLAPDKCLECCCCHEVCPEDAIEMAQSRLLSFLRGGRLP